MSNIDVTKLTDFELQEQYRNCVKQLASMKYNMEIVNLFAQIEDEIAKRERIKNGDLQKLGPRDSE